MHSEHNSFQEILTSTILTSEIECRAPRRIKSDQVAKTAQEQLSAPRENGECCICHVGSLCFNQNDLIFSLLYGVQAERIHADAGDNILALLSKQTVTRVLLKKAVPVMVARLGPRCPSASSRSVLTPIVQTVVVEHNIAGIASREEYIALRDASSEAEGVFISNLQATLQEHGGLAQVCEGHGRGIRGGTYRVLHDQLCQGACVWHGEWTSSRAQESPCSSSLLCTSLPPPERYTALLCGRIPPHP